MNTTGRENPLSGLAWVYWRIVGYYKLWKLYRALIASAKSIEAWSDAVKRELDKKEAERNAE